MSCVFRDEFVKEGLFDLFKMWYKNFAYLRVLAKYSLRNFNQTQPRSQCASSIFSQGNAVRNFLICKYNLRQKLALQFLI